MIETLREITINNMVERNERIGVKEERGACVCVCGLEFFHRQACSLVTSIYSIMLGWKWAWNCFEWIDRLKK